MSRRTCGLLLCLIRDLRIFSFLMSGEVQNEVWELMEEEHINFKTRRAQVTNKDDSYQLPEGHATVARGYLKILRDEMPKIARPFLKKLLAGEAKIGDVDPLDFWKRQAELGRTDDNYAHFSAVAQTACMLLSAPGNTATSERGVGRLRRTATPYRNMLSENMLEQEVICSHFINGPLYKFSQVIEMVATVQRELLSKK